MEKAEEKAKKAEEKAKADVAAVKREARKTIRIGGLLLDVELDLQLLYIIVLRRFRPHGVEYWCYVGTEDCPQNKPRYLDDVRRENLPADKYTSGDQSWRIRNADAPTWIKDKLRDGWMSAPGRGHLAGVGPAGAPNDGFLQGPRRASRPGPPQTHGG